MKKLIIILTLFILIVCLGYILFSCVIKVDDKFICIARDVETNALYILKPGYNFFWQGAVPGRLSLYNISNENMEFFEFRIMGNTVEKLQSDTYAIGIDLNIIYSLDESTVAKLFHPQMTEEQNKEANVFSSVIYKFLKGNLNELLSPYLSPVYRRSEILRNRDGIVEKAVERLKTQCGPLGISIKKFELVGGIDLPENEVYYEGMRYGAELREKEKNNKKELIILNGKLKREKNSDQMYYERLEEISRIIRDNPDILKYIYIDKMADNVKVIVAPERSGVPLGLDGGNEEEAGSVAGEIDNLR